LKILIVSTWWPPKQGIAVQRPLAWANTWAQDGHDVTVLTEYLGQEVAETTGSEIERLCSPVRVVGVANPLRRLAPVKPERAEGPETNGHGRAGKASPVRWLRARLNSLSDRTGIMRSGRMPDPQAPWARRALAALGNDRWDLVISTSGPYPVHRIGYELRRRGRCGFWAADFRDLWVDNHIYPGLFPFTVFERLLEARWMRRADCLVTVSEALARSLRRRHGDKVITSYNGFSRADFETPLAPPRSDAGDSLADSDASSGSAPDKGTDTGDTPGDADVFTLVYTGTYYPSLYDITPLLTALEELRQSRPDVKLRVRVFGRCEALATIVASRPVAASFEFAGMVCRSEALLAQRRADALIFLGVGGARGEGIYTGKAFEYLASGRPIVAVGVDPDGDVAELLERGGSASCCGDDAAGISRALATLIDSRAQAVGERRAAGIPAAVMQYERGEQARLLLERLRALKPGTGC
jgi:glycosyltransferase involved in cell wall biosynthesis